MNDERLLDEVEDLLKTSPPQSAFTELENDEVLDWLGRTGAILKKLPTVLHIVDSGPCYTGLDTIFG